jgi:deoxyhypusine monooxygenase
MCRARVQGASEESPYLSVDPAPAAARAPVAVLQATLCDAAAPLYDRYRAMFALRNINSPEAAMVRQRERAARVLLRVL